MRQGGKAALLGMLVAPALLAVLDGFFFTALHYLITIGVGAGVGAVLGRFAWPAVARWAMVFAAGAVLSLGVAAGISMLSGGANWNRHSSFVHCRNLVGSPLHRSPFGDGDPTCGAYNMCANEYSYTPEQRQEFEARVRADGCAW